MTNKKCILCGMMIDKPWGDSELFKHEETHDAKRFLGYVEQKDNEGPCSICGGENGDHEDDCDYE